jgi:hypothetical protein
MVQLSRALFASPTMSALVAESVTPKYLNFSTTSIPALSDLLFISMSCVMVFVLFLLMSRLSLLIYSNSVMTLAVSAALLTSTAISSAYLPIKCYSHIFLSSFDFLSTLSTTKLKNYGLSGEPCITSFTTFILTPKISMSFTSSRLMISYTQ